MLFWCLSWTVNCFDVYGWCLWSIDFDVYGQLFWCLSWTVNCFDVYTTAFGLFQQASHFGSSFNGGGHKSWGLRADSFPPLYFGQVKLPQDYITAGSRRGRRSRERSVNQLTKNPEAHKDQKTFFYTEFDTLSHFEPEDGSKDHLARVDPNDHYFLPASGFKSLVAFDGPDYTSIAHEAAGRAQAAAQNLEIITQLENDHQLRNIRRVQQPKISTTEPSRPPQPSTTHASHDNQTWQATSPVAIQKLNHQNLAPKNLQHKTMRFAAPSSTPQGRPLQRPSARRPDSAQRTRNNKPRRLRGGGPTRHRPTTFRRGSRRQA